MIIVTKHAVEQFKARIILNSEMKAENIIKNIKLLFQQSEYISDNEKGILFRNKDLMIEFIVKNGCIVTLFPVGKKGVK